MTSAATKWKEFKAELKKAFMKLYHDYMEEEELLALCDERVHERCYTASSIWSGDNRWSSLWEMYCMAT